jgi:alpha-galactosidase
MDRTRVKAGGIEVRLDGGEDDFRSSLSTSTLESGVELVHLRIESGEAQRPPVFRLSWSYPLVSVHSFWHPGARYDKGLGVDWGKGFYSKATSGAPVGCLYDLKGRNRLTFALSDSLDPVTFHAGVHEESGESSCWVRLFD